MQPRCNRFLLCYGFVQELEFGCCIMGWPSIEMRRTARYSPPNTPPFSANSPIAIPGIALAPDLDRTMIHQCPINLRDGVTAVVRPGAPRPCLCRVW
jgi:hypothetical protein